MDPSAPLFRETGTRGAIVVSARLRKTVSAFLVFPTCLLSHIRSTCDLRTLTSLSSQKLRRKAGQDSIAIKQALERKEMEKDLAAKKKGEFAVAAVVPGCASAWSVFGFGACGVAVRCCSVDGERGVGPANGWRTDEKREESGRMRSGLRARGREQKRE